MIKVGLTGGIGSGKSTAARMFSDQGTRIIDADIISHQITQSSECLDEIISVFGEKFLTTSGKLDRKEISKVIFNNPAQKTILEGILHPEIKRIMLDQAGNFTNEPYVILVIPLLFETDFIDITNRTLVVDSPLETRVERIMQRDHIDRAQTRKIINNQVDRNTSLKLADDVIHNTGGLDDLLISVIKLHQIYIQASN